MKARILEKITAGLGISVYVDSYDDNKIAKFIYIYFYDWHYYPPSLSFNCFIRKLFINFLGLEDSLTINLKYLFQC